MAQRDRLGQIHADRAPRVFTETPDTYSLRFRGGVPCFIGFPGRGHGDTVAEPLTKSGIRAHLGKTIFRDLLKVVWATEFGTQDSMALWVKTSTAGSRRSGLNSIVSMEPDAVEIRVVGCLLEKQRTTPDAYPLSLNALRLACNQATNRDPVANYDETAVVEALRRTALRGWTRLASGAGSRARKYRHLLDEALDADPAELALLAVLMLRGVQTPGELKQRADRQHAFADLPAVHETLEKLVERGYVERLPRRPGQKEERYAQLLGGEGGASSSVKPEVATDSSASVPSSSGPSAEEDRLERLERELGDLREQVRLLREALGEPSPPQA